MDIRSENYCVLVMGYRQGLCDALSRLDIRHAVWSEKELKSTRQFLYLHVEKFPRDHHRIDEILSGFKTAQPFTHVIAATESAVYPAAVARRILQTRISTKSVAMRCHDKLLMKSYLREHDIPMTDFIAGEDIQDANAVIKRLGTPVVIKIRDESGGRGIQLVDNSEDLIRYAGRNKILERFVAASEASVESFINRNEILFENVTQYYVKQHINLVPCHLPSEQQQALLDLNRRVIKALKIKWGMTHMEAYLTKQGILFGEIALRPPGGYIMELLSKAYGFSAWEALIHVELDLPFEFPKTHRCYTASYILHPGAGEVKQIDGWDNVVGLSSVYKAKLKIKPGTSMKKRSGVGEDAGYIFFSTKNQKQLLQDVDCATKKLQFVILT